MSRDYFLIILILSIVLISGCIQQSPVLVENTTIEKSGLITNNEVWSGNIFVTGSIVVPKGVTLTIEPGTKVMFKNYRGYKEPEKLIRFDVLGTLKAIGTGKKQILFTSDSADPINGDWSGIWMQNSNSVIDHAIIEFGEVGIVQTDSSVSVTNSIIRYTNSEGLYAERSSPVFINNTLYGNGYHEIALEQYNNAIIKNNIFMNGRVAIHHEETISIIEGNYFNNYPDFAISAGMESNVTIEKNKFENIKGNPFNIYQSASVVNGNDFGNNTIEIPVFDYSDMNNHPLNYIPGDPEDRYMYVYPDDETRKTVKKLGKDMYFGWTLLYANNSLWRFSLGSGEFGKGMDLIKIDPETGAYTKFGSNEIMNPRGLAFDGEYFYVNDFSLLKIFKFKLKDNAKQGDFIDVVKSFDIPEKELGGTMALTYDGFLYLKSRDGSKLYKLDKNGNLLGEIKFVNPTAVQCLVSTGDYFWSCSGCRKGLCKFTKDGKLAGEIYPPAKDTWALAWDGKYLWSLQRTSELWNDPKIYKIKILSS